MTKSWLIGTTALMLLSSAAWATDEASAAATASAEHGDAAEGGKHGFHHGNATLEEARAHAHKHAEKLDKMTPEEFEKKKQARKERHEKWKAMTPEQKAKFKEERRAKHHAKDGSAPAPGDDKPVAK